MLMLLAILLPLLCGAVIGFARPKGKPLFALTLSATVLTGLLALAAAFFGAPLALFSFGENLPFFLRADGFGKLFTLLATGLWILAVIYSRSYMAHAERESRFNSFLLLTLGGMLGVGYAGNLLTLYLFFESVTLLSLPLVLQNGTKEALSAGKKYLFYSIAGAFLALPAICMILLCAGPTAFTLGGILDPAKAAGHEGALRVLTFLAIIGFGAKAGMFPLHAWLTAAHPASPAPASALLSGMIAKAGIFAVLRLTYFSVGTDLLSGSWVQYAWLILAVLTVFMGSMLALWEENFKKRLAYSTVSNLSYIMIGLAMLTPEGLAAGFMHLLAHALAKTVLFFCAGAAMEKMGAVKVSDLRFWGKRMPVTVGCFLVAGLSLIGIPPLAGFSSKWFLCLSALQFENTALSLIAPAILVLSALLTAGYLLPPALGGFFPGKEAEKEIGPKCETDKKMLVPMLLLCAASLALGVFAAPVQNWLLSLL